MTDKPDLVSSPRPPLRLPPNWVDVIKGALGIATVLVIEGFSIGSIDSMPPYAVVFLDDTSKTFIALPCIEEWRSRPT
jgi:hypothetical protein